MGATVVALLLLLHLQRDYRFNVKLAIASPSWFTRCHPQNELVAISHPAKCQKLPRGKLLVVSLAAALNFLFSSFHGWAAAVARSGDGTALAWKIEFLMEHYRHF